MSIADGVLDVGLTCKGPFGLPDTSTLQQPPLLVPS